MAKAICFLKQIVDDYPQGARWGNEQVVETETRKLVGEEEKKDSERPQNIFSH